MKYSLDELLVRRLEGWDADEWLFLVIGQPVKFLADWNRLEISDQYHGVSEFGVIVVARDGDVSRAWGEVDKLKACNVRCLGFWRLGADYVKELVIEHQSIAPLNLCLEYKWQSIVTQLAEAKRAA